MQITRILYHSGPDGDAEVEVAGGGVTCEAWACPFTGSVGQVLSRPLHANGVRHAMLTDGGTPGFWRIGGAGLSQRVVADVVDAKRALLRVGGIDLEAHDDLFGGVADGDRIEFECASVELWCELSEVAHTLLRPPQVPGVLPASNDPTAILRAAQAWTEARLAAAPDFAPLRSISAQVRHLLDLTEGRSSDRSRLREIIVGVLAAREFEGHDPDYAELLYRVEAVVSGLKARDC